jgi:hypothetical protein
LLIDSFFGCFKHPSPSCAFSELPNSTQNGIWKKKPTRNKQSGADKTAENSKVVAVAAAFKCFL